MAKSSEQKPRKEEKKKGQNNTNSQVYPGKPTPHKKKDKGKKPKASASTSKHSPHSPQPLPVGGDAAEIRPNSSQANAIELTPEIIEDFKITLNKVHQLFKNSKDNKKRKLIAEFKKNCSSEIMGNIFDYLPKSVEDLRNLRHPPDRMVTTKTDVECPAEPAVDYDTSSKNIPKELTRLHEELDEVKKNKRKLDEDYESSQQVIKKLKKQTEDLSYRLAQEMGKKLSADESAVENVSIRNRPMNIAEEYNLLCSNQWLDAKNELDENFQHVEECNKVEYLHKVYEAAEEEVKTLIAKVTIETNKVLHKLYQPTSFMMQKGDGQTKNYIKNRKSMHSTHENSEKNKQLKLMQSAPSRMDTSTSVDAAPVELKNAVGDFLRNTADIIDLEELEKAVYDALSNKLGPNTKSTGSSDVNNMWKTAHKLKDVKLFIKSVVMLAWKMVIQRPCMRFKYYNQWKGDGYHDIYWGSVSPHKPHTMYEVYPLLYHGDKFMGKGKALLKEQINHIYSTQI